MSAIDKLKGGIVIDTFNDNNNAADIGSDNNIVLDLSNSADQNDNDINVVQLGKTNRHTTVLPKDNNQGNRQPIMQSVNLNSRKAVSIDTISEPEEPDPNIKDSYEKEILDLDDPNSMFSKYVRETVQEANEWLAEKKEEDMLKEEEKEIEEGLDNDNSYGLKSDNIIIDENAFTENDYKMQKNVTLMETEDLSSLLDDDEDNIIENKKESIKEEQKMSVNENIEMEEEKIDSLAVDEEEFDDLDDDPEGEIVDEAEEEPVVAAAPIKEEKKDPIVKETYSAELDVEISDSNENFTDEIVEEDETVNQEVDPNETLKHLQKLATEKLKPVSKKLDISSFTVLKKPVTNISPLFKETNARVCKWILPSQESVVLMKEFSGAELEKLREYSQQNGSVDALNRRYHLIYDHIMSPKPATFEQWLKTTPFEDVDHYFFSIYIASFKNANYLPADCINKDCNETFISDDIDIMSMVKFDTKEGKNKFLELYQSEATPAGKGVYCTEIVPISNKVAVAFRQPSIYNVFEIASLTDAVRNKYSSIIEYIPYIDTIYAIDEQAGTLTPITYKMFNDNAQKTVRSKIQKYDNVFNTLGVDEFGVIKAYISALVSKTVDIKYIYPAIECPKCHTMTNEQQVTAEELVFTRYQLGALVSTSLS